MRQYVAYSIVMSAILSAQPSATSPAFEVASVTLAPDVAIGPSSISGPPETRLRFQGGPGTRSPERVHYVGVTLKMLMQRAYAVKPEQVEGPNWLATQRYTITAKVPLGTTQADCRLMLRNLLNERFQMRLHTETRSFRVYYLVVSKKGPKLIPKGTVTSPNDEELRRKALQDGLDGMNAKIEALPFRPTASLGVGRGTMSDFIERLSPYLDHPVIDHTQLDGLYGFSLHWVADIGPQTDDKPRGPSLFAALEEQLGLKLTSGRDDLQVLVIDAVQRTPVE